MIQWTKQSSSGCFICSSHSSFKIFKWTSRSQLKGEIKKQRGWSERRTKWLWISLRHMPWLPLLENLRRLPSANPLGLMTKLTPSSASKARSHLNRFRCSPALHSLVWLHSVAGCDRESRTGQHTHAPRYQYILVHLQGRRGGSRWALKYKPRRQAWRLCLSAKDKRGKSLSEARTSRKTSWQHLLKHLTGWLFKGHCFTWKVENRS